MTNTKAWNTWIWHIPFFALQKSPHSWLSSISVIIRQYILPSMKHLYWWWHVWLCISDSHCTSMADLRLITVCINTENKCHHVLVSQNLDSNRLLYLVQKKVEIVFLLFCKVVSIDCILILFVFFLKTCLGIPAKSPSQRKSLRSSWYLPWDTLYRVCGHFFHFFHFFLQFISPLFLHISPGTHSAASVSALVKTKTNFTQTFYNFAVCDL